MLSDVDFELPSGYVLGVIGRNGSGKTTLMRMLLGSCMPEEGGDSFINGVSLREDVVRYKRQVAFVLGDTPFPLLINAEACGELYGHYYDAFDLHKYKKLLQEFEVPQKAMLIRLSKGQMIRQQLAFALSYRANLYLFDEPTANLDVDFRDEFHKYVRQITAREDAGVVYVSHLVDELEQFADYILWLSTGREDPTRKTTTRVSLQRYFATMDSLRERFQLIESSREEVPDIRDENIVGVRAGKHHQEMLVQVDREQLPDEIQGVSRYASLKELMYYIETGGEPDEAGVERTES